MNRMKLGWMGAGLLAAMAGTANAADAGLSRDALLKLADSYFAALVAHNPSALSVPLASDVKIVENLKRIKTNEGMWKTASSGPTAFKIVIPDTWSQEVGGIIVMGSDNNPVQLGFRLKVVGGRIVEAEHLVQGNRGGGELNANLKAVRAPMPLEVPFEYADSRGRLVHIAKSYYDALDNNNGYLAPFASDLRAPRERHAHCAERRSVAHYWSGACASCWRRTGSRGSASRSWSPPGRIAGLHAADQFRCLPVHHHHRGSSRGSC